MRKRLETDTLIQEMNRYYDARAPWHDYYMEYESNERLEAQLWPIVVDVTPMISGKRILEIACGTGNWTKVLAKRANHVIAIDSSEKAITIAREKLDSASNVTIDVGDAYSLDAIDDIFDVIFASDWWSHIPLGRLPRFVESVNSRLAYHGRAIFLDMSMNEYFAAESCQYDEDGNRISPRRSPDGRTFRVVKNFPGEVELRKLLGGRTSDFWYKSYDTLKRWMMSFTPQ